MLSLIVAMNANRLIGRDNDLPWHLPADLKYFKQQTLGKTILMGRKTHESIGKALPKRENVILTRNAEAQYPDCRVVMDLQALDWQGNDEIMVIGGGEIYRLCLPLAQRLYITRVDAPNLEGNVYFPAFDAEDWRCVWTETHAADERNDYAYTFERWERRVEG